MKKLLFNLMALASLALAQSTVAAEYYVSKQGDDSNLGSKKSPFLTIQKAATQMKAGDICLIDDGIYYETVVVSNTDASDKRVTFRPAKPKGDVIITGSEPIPSSSWKKVSKNIFKCSVKMTHGDENQLFLGRKQLVVARWPNVGDDLLMPTLADMDEGTTPTLVVDDNLPNFDFTGGTIWVQAPAYWLDWTGDILGSKEKQIEIDNMSPLKDHDMPKHRHVAIAGAWYFVYGFLDALDAENEWYYDEAKGELYIYRANGRLPKEDYYYNSRPISIDLSDCRNVTIESLNILGSYIQTNDSTEGVVIDGVSILYPYYRTKQNQNTPNIMDSGMVLRGRNNTIQNSEIAYSAGPCITLDGEDNKLLNSYIHDGNTVGAMAGVVTLQGKGNVISHCTITRGGRTCIRYSKMYQSLIQHCVLSHSGYLTSDLGLTYGTNTEGGNSEVRYNLMHTVHGYSQEHNVGLYYDHGTKNIITHHNIIWGADNSGLKINHYAANHLVYNNTFISKLIGFNSCWGNKYAPDIFNCRFVNNLFSAPSTTTADNYYWKNNPFDFDNFDPENPMKGYAKGYGKGVYIEGISQDAERPGIGAIEYEGMTFVAGHDFDNPPTSYNFERTECKYRNLLTNSAFENEDFRYPWQCTQGSDQKESVLFLEHALKAQLTPDVEIGRIGSRTAQLLDDGSELYQSVGGLKSGESYEFSAHLRVFGGDKAIVGVRFPNGEEQFGFAATRGAPNWNRVSVAFDMPAGVTEVEVFVRRLSSRADGKDIYVDDLSLNIL